MEKVEEEIIRSAEMDLPGAVVEAKILRPKRLSIVTRAERALELARYLRDKHGFDHPISAGAIDYMEENRFQVVYYVLSSTRGILLMLRVNVARDKPINPTLTPVWEAMDWHEREAWEMFGVEFEGHPNLARLLLPEDWEGGHPLRKDFSLKPYGGV